MTHRERLMAAVSHKQPDKVPIDLGGTRDSSIVVEGYQKLQEHFGLKGEPRLCDRMMRVVHVDEEVLRALDIDGRAVFPGGSVRGRAEVLGPRSYRDDWGVVRVQPEGSYYCDQREFPLSGEITVSDIARYPWPDPEDPGLVQGLKERVKWIRENTDCAAILTLPAPFVHASQYLRGFEDWFMDFILNPRLLEALFDAVLEVTMRTARNQLLEVGREVDIVICADDLGTQNGLQVSLATYREMVKPHHARLWRRLKDLSGKPLLLHSCGSIYETIPDLIEMGVDAINPVQVAAANMDSARLKREFGRDLTFWGGGCDTQTVLERGTPQEVREEVRRRCGDLAPGGGFVFCQVHNIQPTVPPENVMAMYEAVAELGG